MHIILSKGRTYNIPYHFIMGHHQLFVPLKFSQFEFCYVRSSCFWNNFFVQYTPNSNLVYQTIHIFHYESIHHFIPSIYFKWVRQRESTFRSRYIRKKLEVPICILYRGINGGKDHTRDTTSILSSTDRS